MINNNNNNDTTTTTTTNNNNKHNNNDNNSTNNECGPQPGSESISQRAQFINHLIYSVNL